MRRGIDIGSYLEPEELAQQLAHEKGFVFLDSSLPVAGAVSLLATNPERILSGGPGDWTVVEAELEKRARVAGDIGLPCGGLIGWIDFDGSYRFGVYENLLIFQHDSQEWICVGETAIPDARATQPARPPQFVSATSKDTYCAMVRRAQEYIAAGDIYQVCLAHAFESPWEGDPWRFYSELRQASPAPYAGFLHLGDTWVLSASPECFLRMSGTRIVTRPIKGTRPRREDYHADERSAYELITSSKEIAELVMITDLERSDLGQVCNFGTVRVPELLQMERFAQVFHLVSTVEGELRAGVTHPHALRACFPGGSISGAPKKRAIEIIRELEPAPRGIYTGAIGFFGFNGESAFNIAIRTVVVEAGHASFHSGAGIVADSIPEMEWEETLHKASGILAAADRLAGSAPHIAPTHRAK